MAMIHSAPWVGFDDLCEAPLVRCCFQADETVEAVLEICGLGFCEPTLNGQLVTEDKLIPAWSDYEDRGVRRMAYPIHDTFSHRIYYNRYEVTPWIVPGANTLGVRLGNGWYNQHERNAEGDFWYGKPKLCFALTLTAADGQIKTFFSDENLRWHESEILFNNIYYGEEQDLRKISDGWNQNGFDASAWKPVSVLPAPTSPLMEQKSPADRIIETLNPVLVSEGMGRRIYDAGRNTTGWAVLEAHGCGLRDVVQVRYAEELNPDGTLNFETSGGDGQIAEDRYILHYGRCELRPHFTLHGFRYFEITGNAQPLCVEVVHCDVPVTSTFQCEEPVLQWLYDTYLNTQLTNIHYGGVPSDCPHRERLGYTGDGQLAVGASLLCLGAEEVYRKWMGDIADSQCQKSGHVQHTAPFFGGGGGPGGWGCAIVEVPYQFWRFYGDPTVLEDYYPHMTAWFGYMQAHCENGLVVREEKDGWCLGDWCTLEKVEIPEPLVNTYYFARSLAEGAEIARILGREEEARHWEALRTTLLDALTRTYWDEATHQFCGGIQGADAFALDLGLGDEQTLAALVKKYTALGHFDTGIFGTDILCKVLFERGFGDLAYQLLTGTQPGSYGFMRSQGATTLYEYWTAQKSHNHPMFGAPVRYLFTQLLGITQAKNSSGFEATEIRPVFAAGLNQCAGSITTPKGRIAVEWVRDGKRFHITLTNPGCEISLCCFGSRIPVPTGTHSYVLEPCE